MESNKSYPRDDVEQRRARVEAALRAEPRKSAAEVARDLGVSRDVTQKIRRAIMAGENTRDRRTIVRVGTEEWLRPGPNQRMSRNRRTTCRQFR